MGWVDDFLVLAGWTLQLQDLRHRYLYASHAKSLLSSPGIAYAYETMISLSIYEAALGKGYVDGKSIWCEKPFPGDPARNSRRADLAFRNSGKGHSWAYVEVKSFNNGGAASVLKDVAKLSTITARATKWLFVYRVAAHATAKSRPLSETLKGLSPQITRVLKGQPFDTIDDKDRGASCEFCLAQLK